MFISDSSKYNISKSKGDILTSSNTFTELDSLYECEYSEMWCCLYFRSSLNCWIGFITFLRYVHHCSDNSCSMVKQNQSNTLLSFFTNRSLRCRFFGFLKKKQTAFNIKRKWNVWPTFIFKTKLPFKCENTKPTKIHKVRKTFISNVLFIE